MPGSYPVQRGLALKEENIVSGQSQEIAMSSYFAITIANCQPQFHGGLFSQEESQKFYSWRGLMN